MMHFICFPKLKPLQANVAASRPAPMNVAAGFLAMLAFLIAVIPLYGQTATATTTTSANQGQVSARAPLPRLYWYFFRYQEFLDSKADEIEKKGGNGAGLRESLQRRSGFSAYQFQLIREAASKLDADLKQKDAQAKAIIDAFHAKYPPGQPLSGPLPPPPPELAQLQQERENLIAQDVANLKAELGPDASGKLDSFLRNDFAPMVKTRPANIQIPSGPPPTHSSAAQKAVQP